jgi:uncharacterized protein (DUF2237 family)
MATIVVATAANIGGYLRIDPPPLNVWMVRTVAQAIGRVQAVTVRDTEHVERNVFGGQLETCSLNPLTGFYRDGCCHTGPEDLGSHTICAVVSSEFLDHQQEIGNDLSTPAPQFGFPGLTPGDRWCVTARNWARAHAAGVAAYVVLAATHERALEIVPLQTLQEYAVDVPADPGALNS